LPVFAQFVAFDLETTGLKPESNQIIEVAGVRFTFELKNQKIVPKILKTFESFVRPTMMIPAEATQVNHITDSMVENAPSSKEVLNNFSRFIGLSTILVAHNADFDCRFLIRELRLNGLILPQNPVLDSLKLSRKIIPESPSHRLGNLAKRLQQELGINLDSENLHRALYDCEILAEVFTALIRKRFQPKDLEMSNFLTAVEKVHGPASFLH
jgi:DNA polymerase-3 subunit alpha (Gram-positive type)